MTGRHIAILRFIRGYVETNGLYPSLREIGAGIGSKSLGNIQQWLTDLVREGHMRRLPAKERAIELQVDITIPRAPDGAPLYAVRIGGLL
jgi:SOS-response transcriptional repressor LexA